MGCSRSLATVLFVFIGFIGLNLSCMKDSEVVVYHTHTVKVYLLEQTFQGVLD